MKNTSSKKWFGLLLVLLLSFSFFFPLLHPSFLTRVSDSEWFGGFRTFDPIVPQPTNPEYLIIGPNDAWVQSFAEWKNLKGVPTQVANVTWINSAFVGRDLAERIWAFINSVYTSTTPATLKWVLLIGDNSTLPSRYIYLPDPTNEWTGLSTTLKPTDFYYSVMGDANWDDDNDGLWGECNTFNVGGPTTDEIGDWQPDVYVGRIPVSDQGNITTILSRTITYSRNPTTFSSTGWDSFLLAGAISNYDEEVSAWRDSDYTDEAELSDYINDNIIPGYYNRYRFYENRMYFWNYSSPNSFQTLNSTAVWQGINVFEPALINLAGHGSPYDMQRKFDPDILPYGLAHRPSTNGWAVNISGIAIGDCDNDGQNEIVYTLGIGTPVSLQNGTVWMSDGPNYMAPPTLIWDLWLNPPPGNPAAFATCVDIGDIWNNGTIAVVVGTSAGSVIAFTFWNNIKWTAVTISGPEPTDPVLSIEVGNADNAILPNGAPGVNTDIAWGHKSGFVFIATSLGGLPHAVALIWNHAQSVYSIDVGDPNDDGWGEITCGTGYAGPNGDVYILQYLWPGPWIRFSVDLAVGGIVYGLDTGDAGNDGSNKVVIGLSNGAIYMYEAGSASYPGFVGGNDSLTQQTISPPGANAGLVRSLVVGYVDDNDIMSTPQVERTSIIAGNAWNGIRKYHADNSSGFVDFVVMQREMLLWPGPTITALDVGELSYSYGEVTANLEVASGSDFLGIVFPIPQMTWFEWPYAQWGNLISTGQVGNITSNIPSLVFSDACLTSAYDYPTRSLGSDFLRYSAIGYIGSMRISWYYRGTMAVSFSWGLSRWMNQDYWQVFFSGSTNFRPGDTLFVSKSNYIAQFQGAHTQATWETYHRKNLLSFALFGDPEVDVFTDNPGTLTVSYPSNALYAGDTVFRVMDGTTPVPGATICLWDKDGSYYEVQTTNSTGHAILQVTASVPNSINVTVTAHNYQPHEGNIGVQHWIDVARPSISFTAGTLTLDITAVTASCSNPAHGALDNIEATTYTYTIYDNATDTATALSGNLAWTGSQWQITGLDVSPLPDGSYYVQCVFSDTDVSATTSPKSDVFTISAVGPPPFDFIQWLLDNWLFIIMAIVIVLLLIIIIVIFRRRKPKE